MANNMGSFGAIVGLVRQISRFFTTTLALTAKDMEEALTDFTGTLDSFTCFGKLPLELRLKIWHDSMPESRIVEIRFNMAKKFFVADADIPIALHVCQESRREAPRRYSLLIFEYEAYSELQYQLFSLVFQHGLFEAGLTGDNVPNKNFQQLRLRPFATYLDFSQDIVYISKDSETDFDNAGSLSTILYELSVSQQVSKIKHIAFAQNYLLRQYSDEILEYIPNVIANASSFSAVFFDIGINEWCLSKGRFAHSGMVERFIAFDPKTKVHTLATPGDV